MTESIIKNKSFKFTLTVIELYKKLVKGKEYVISKQLLRSATSVGANVEEAVSAQSRKDFIHKMSIAAKEARETKYWLELLNESGLVKLDYSKYLTESDEIIKVLVKIVKTSSEK